jgi:hypothetical protein
MHLPINKNMKNRVTKNRGILLVCLREEVCVQGRANLRKKNRGVHSDGKNC